MRGVLQGQGEGPSRAKGTDLLIEAWLVCILHLRGSTFQPAESGLLGWGRLSWVT